MPLSTLDILWIILLVAFLTLVLLVAFVYVRYAGGGRRGAGGRDQDVELGRVIFGPRPDDRSVTMGDTPRITDETGSGYQIEDVRPDATANPNTHTYTIPQESSHPTPETLQQQFAVRTPKKKRKRKRPEDGVVGGDRAEEEEHPVRRVRFASPPEVREISPMGESSRERVHGTREERARWGRSGSRNRSRSMSRSRTGSRSESESENDVERGAVESGEDTGRGRR